MYYTVIRWVRSDKLEYNLSTVLDEGDPLHVEKYLNKSNQAKKLLNICDENSKMTPLYKIALETANWKLVETLRIFQIFSKKLS